MRKIETVWTALRQLKSACDAYNVPFLGALRSTVDLYRSGQFSLKEILGYALYVPEIRHTIPVLISKERSLSKLAAMNPAKNQAQTEDKEVFYRKCRTANLPVPECFGVFDGGTGRDGEGNALAGRDCWVAHFEAVLPERFIMKDSGGAYASGFAAFERRGTMFQMIDGGVFDAAGLYDELAARAPASFILQERLFDHPQIEALSGCKGLQTMRINTYRNGDDNVSLLFYMIKVLVGNNIADNFSMGATGNLIAIGRPGEGVLEGARTLHPCGSGLITIEAHPQTGKSFKGYRIPLWDEAVELAKSAHRAFPEFGSLGWDIAVTPTGPKIIEANAWWDPPNYAPQIMSPENWHRIFG